MSQSEPAGNTITAGPIKQEKYKNYQIYRVFFTYNIDKPNEPTPEDFWNLLLEHCKKFEFQLEQGKTGNYHYQGWFSLKQKEYFNTIKNMFPKMHIEPQKDYFASKAYCTKKDETYRDGPWNEKSTFIKIIEPNQEWQTDLFIDLMQEPDNRKIIWIVDFEGGKGKSQFCKYMKVKEGACVLLNGKSKDLAMLIDDPKIVLIDTERELEFKFNYSILEQLKNGMVFSPKFESKIKIFNSPHVVVLANFEPDKSKFSKDRWDIRYI